MTTCCAIKKDGVQCGLKATCEGDMCKRHFNIQKKKTEQTAFEETNTECPICYEVITAKTRDVTSCNHMFHKKCLSMWLAAHDTCPCCREPILPPLEVIKGQMQRFLVTALYNYDTVATMQVTEELRRKLDAAVKMYPQDMCLQSQMHILDALIGNHVE